VADRSLTGSTGRSPAIQNVKRRDPCITRGRRVDDTCPNSALV
jgi:hypothetical protein